MASSFYDTNLRGWIFLSIGSFLFLALFIKFLPTSQFPIISSFQNDWYYCFLVPLTLPIIVVAVYFHWLSMKMFKHA